MFDSAWGFAVSGCAMRVRSKAVRAASRAVRRLRRQARQARWLAAALSGVLLVVLATQPAQAVIAEHALTSAAPVLPHQRTGSAAGLSHQVGASATRPKTKHSASSHKPAAVKGALPAAKTSLPPKNPRLSFSSPKGSSVKPVTPPLSVRTAWLKKHQPAQSAKGAQGDPRLPGPAASGSEVVADRTANTSVFRNADGTYTARVYSRPVHYRTSDGSWADIDTALAKDSSGRWQEKADAPSASFAPTGDDPTLVSYGPTSSQQVAFSLQGAAPVTGTVSGDTITYPGIAASSDLEYAATAAGVKETLVLHSASAPTTWVFPLKDTGLTPSLGPGGSVVFKDASGAVRATIPHGYMEDANLGKVSGEGAISTGVTYSLITVDGAPALKVSLDSSWLHDSSRVFPVTVDPTDLNASSSTYVETPYDINFSTADALKVGSYDNGQHKANSYVLNWSFGTTFKNDYIEQATLNLDDVWSGGCTAEPVDVHAITSAWTVGQIADYPGLSYGPTIGSASFDAGSTCGGSSWHGIDLGDKATSPGVQLLEGWAHGGTNEGLALTADTSVVAAWKQFASVNSSYPPYLSVTYTTYGADYSVPSQTYVLPTTTTYGSMQVKVTNRGTTAWTASNMTLSDDVYTTSWTAIHAISPRVAVPSTVNPNSTVTMTGSIGPIAAGQYYVCWDMYLNGSTSFYLNYNVPAYCLEITSSDTPPQIDSTSPTSNAALGSLTPQLFASGHDPDNYPGSGLTYDFQVYTDPTSGSPSLVADSGSISTSDWVVPADKLAWNQSYYWQVSDSDSLASSTWSSPSYFTTSVPQPLVTSHLGGAVQGPDGRTFDPRVGNYTTSATDASVSVAGPALSVARTYNSLDPRTSGLFGAGWSTLYDMSAVPDGDGSGSVVVTLADGQQARFALNQDGTTFAPPQGTYATLAAVSGGGYTLTDKSGTAYAFGQQSGSAWKLTSVTDAAGRAETLTYNGDGTLATATNTTSDRSLHFTWSGGHVSEVATDPATSGGSGESWTYAYSGDELASVCPPTSATACTDYSYTSGSSSGSHYRSAVIDANPSSYWRLAESSGTTAASDVAVNEGDDDGTYTGGVTLGAAGPLPGSPTTAATFDGSSGYVSLPNSALTAASYTAIGLWFKTTGSGVLLSYQKDALTGSSTPGNYTPALYVGTSGKLYGELWDNSVAPITTSSSVADGNWHYVVLTAAGTSQSLYLDGALVGSLSGQVKVSGQPVDAIGTGFLGGKWPDEPHYSTSSNTGYRTFFGGSIAEVALYTHTLGQPAIQQQYAAGTTAAAELTGITLPSGKTELTADYDPADDRATQITDATGGSWTLHDPTTTGTGAAYRSTVETAGPVDYWRLGDSSGSQAVNEVPGFGTSVGGWWSDGPSTYHNVTLGAPGLFTGGPETAASFNGTSSYVELPFSSVVGNFSPSLSVGLWFKTSTAGGVLFSYQSDPIGSTPSDYTPGLYVGSDGHLYGQWWDDLLSPMESPGTVTDGQWHQAVLTIDDNGQQILYLDGQQVGQRTGNGFDANTDQLNVSVGAGYIAGSWPAKPAGNAQGYFTGSIAEVAGYETALPASTVAAQYTARGAASGATPVTTATVTDPGGHTLTYHYDPTNDDRLLSSTDALGHTTSYGYDTGGFPATVTQPDGNYTTAAYNSRGDVLSRTTGDGGGDSTTGYYTYPSPGTYSATDPRDDEPTSYADPRSSGPTDTTYATAYTYDSAGDLLTSTDPNSHTTTDTYTTGTESAIGGGTEPPGLLATSKDPDGNTTTYAYNSSGDLAQVTSPTGAQTNDTYDDLGRRLTQTQVSDTYPDGVTTTYTYDAQDRLVTRTGPATTDAVTGTVHTPQTTYGYDDDGDVISQAVADTTGGDTTRTTTWTYTAYDQVATVTDPASRTIGYGYDAYGNRTSETDPDGNAYSYAYSATGELLTTTLTNYTGDPENPTSPTALVTDSRAYDPNGWLASDTDSMGRTTEYAYDWNGRLLYSALANFHNPDGSTTYKYLNDVYYDAAGNITSSYVTNAQLETDYAYDPAGRVTSSTFDPYGLDKATTDTYDGDGDLTSQSVTEGSATEQTDYAYDALGDVTTQTVHDGSSNLVTTHGYDELGQLTSTTDPRGNVTGGDPSAYTTDYAYDAAGNLTQMTAPVVNAETGGGSPQQVHPITLYGYDTFGDQTSLDDPDGDITTYTYDPDSEQVAVSDPAYTPPGSSTAITPTTTQQYNAAGQVSQSTDGDGNATTYTYDQLGDLAQVVQPQVGGNSPTTHTVYDTDGEALSITDPTGAQTTATYDDLGRTLTVSEVVRQPTTVTDTTTYGYDDANNLTSTTQPGGQSTTATYDAAGDQLTSTDPLNNTTTDTYDLDGRLTKTTLPDHTATTDTYDAAGRLTATSALNASGTSVATTDYGHDAAGNTTSVTDPNGNTTTYTYDAANDLTGQVEPVTSTSSISTGFGYDAAGNATRYTDGDGNATITTYNTLGLPESSIEPSTSTYPDSSDRTSTIAYDADGNPVTTTRPGGVTETSTYDADGRLTSQAGSGAEAATTTRTFGYDADGRTTSASAPGGTDTYTYDDRGEILTAAGPSGNATYGYDSDGQLTTRTDAAGTENYTYDDDGHLATATDPLTSSTATYSYNTTGQVTGIGYGTSAAGQSLTYNAQHEVTADTLTKPGGTTEASASYGYDPDGDLTSQTTTGTAGAATNTYTYDQADRLTSWENGAATTSYGYDDAGNRTSLTTGSSTTNATYNARDQLTSTTDGTTTSDYAYTARGTLDTVTTGGSTENLTYDAFDQLATDNSTSYTHDALGRLATAGSNTFGYDGTSTDITTDGTDTFDRTPDGTLLAVTNGTQAALAYTDQHGDLTATFTPTGTTPTGSTAYDPYGQPTATTGTHYDLGYQGGWTDPATARIATASRWYTPTTGTFTSQDPTNQPATPSVNANPYTYGDDNPTTNADPSGECSAYPVFVPGGSPGWTPDWSPSYPDYSNKIAELEDLSNPGYSPVSSAAASHGGLSLGRVLSSFQHVANAVDSVLSSEANSRAIGEALGEVAVAGAIGAVGAGLIAAFGYSSCNVAAAAPPPPTAATGLKENPGKRPTGQADHASAHVNASDLLHKVRNLIGVVAAAAAYQPATNGSTSGALGSALAQPSSGLGAPGGPGGVDPNTLFNLASGAQNAGDCLQHPSLTSCTQAALSFLDIGGAGDEAGLTDGGGSADTAAGCGLSFTASTRVLMADGKSKPIAKVKPGDKVEAGNPTTGKNGGTRTVTARFVNHDDDRVDLTVQTSPHHTSVIHTTARHPFWDATLHAWVQAADLKPGHALESASDQPVRLLSVDALTGTADMYNLTVSQLHTYYVLAGTTPVLVHNSNGSACGVPGAFGPERPLGVGDDWTARVSDNGKGAVWQAPGSTGNANTLRVMNPTPRYPDGYVRFYNQHGQPIGLDGKPGPQSTTHIPLGPDGSYPLPTGW